MSNERVQGILNEISKIEKSLEAQDESVKLIEFAMNNSFKEYPECHVSSDEVIKEMNTLFLENIHLTLKEAKELLGKFVEEKTKDLKELQVKEDQEIRSHNNKIVDGVYALMGLQGIDKVKVEFYWKTMRSKSMSQRVIERSFYQQLQKKIPRSNIAPVLNAIKSHLARGLNEHEFDRRRDKYLKKDIESLGEIKTKKLEEVSSIVPSSAEELEAIKLKIKRINEANSIEELESI